MSASHGVMVTLAYANTHGRPCPWPSSTPNIDTRHSVDSKQWDLPCHAMMAFSVEANVGPGIAHHFVNCHPRTNTPPQTPTTANLSHPHDCHGLPSSQINSEVKTIETGNVKEAEASTRSEDPSCTATRWILSRGTMPWLFTGMYPAWLSIQPAGMHAACGHACI